MTEDNIMIKAATCTPVDFESNLHFWGRDTGLVCRSLRNAGVDCQCIMLGSLPGLDEGGVLRADMGQLASEQWWRLQGLDFVVLYAWADPRYLEIATAIRHAGIYLIQNLDSAGIESPYADSSRWWTCLRSMASGLQPIGSWLRLIGRMARDLAPSLYERKRLRMMAESDLLAVVSPAAADCIADYVSALGASELASHLRVIPHPVPDIMEYDGRTKTRTVIAVGRWNRVDAHQKNPDLTLEVARRFCLSHPEWTFEIIGRGAESLSTAYPMRGNFTSPANLIFTPQLDRNDLRERYLSASTIFCASRYESFHIASAEAVCCGCRVVVPRHPLLASTAWFADNDTGTIADSHHTESLLSALDREVEIMETGAFNPETSARHWQRHLTGNAVAKSILNLYDKQSTSSHKYR